MTETAQHRRVPTTAWVVAIFLWIGLIFFSSTSLAAEWCERGFKFLSAILLSHLHETDSSYGLIHLLADKSVHVGLFLVLAVLLWQVIPHVPRKTGLILLCGAVVGSMSEFLQRFFPGRDPAVRDVLINIGGTLIGATLCITVMRYRARMEAVPSK